MPCYVEKGIKERRRKEVGEGRTNKIAERFCLVTVSVLKTL